MRPCAREDDLAETTARLDFQRTAAERRRVELQQTRLRANRLRAEVLRLEGDKEGELSAIATARSDFSVGRPLRCP